MTIYLKLTSLVAFLMIPLLMFAQVFVDKTCESTQQESGNLSTGIYKAAEQLTSDATINQGSIVIFQANERIQLQNDFKVSSNSSFTAENVACNEIVADVTAVTVSGGSNNYTFAVTISSPDTGCNQYANWWEVISLDGQLIYRRILGHSHVNEQPFTRTGGAVNVSANTEVIVRAWMHPTGYGGKVFKGTVADGFECTVLSGEFAKALSEQDPLPISCPF